ncbi:porin [Phyllobacterium sp. 22229]|uniref:Porin n=1 Tax=Phyllobacterium myrsinacearum TaxID=28101 RepID=A0A2S9JPJ6_9HYPH|nr:porin [Phyllobacterium myrsinacearum]PRD55114.1 porin [Phyllobacterium myrsinacearum]PWV90320.1 porin-like protein [Phyllobacterium myrsinacearum]RZV05485.1 porin-like protein [Phyllobacterium myrsinacearum]
MNIKSLLLGSAAALIAVSGARAADAVVVAEPEAVEYVKVCDAYGAGFFYIPGTETCLKIGGYLRADVQGGDSVYTGGHVNQGSDPNGDGTYDFLTRATIRFDARTETELGTLRSYIETRFNYRNGSNGTSIPQAFIELGGFRIGVADEIFGSWVGYAGDIINDDVIQYNSFASNQVSYTYTGGNGFSAIIAAEQGEAETLNGQSYDYRIDDYMPHALIGAKWEQSWGKISGIAGYDSAVEEWGFKARLDVKITDAVTAWVMGAYQTNYDDRSFNTNVHRNWFGTWEGDYAIWGGLAAKVSDKATVNAQVAYEEQGTLAAALNVAYELVPGFTITPELNYTKFDGARKDYSLAHGGNDDAFGGIIRFQRNF